MNIGSRLKAVRESAGLTQAGLIDRLREEGVNLNQPFISQVERGEKGISLETLVALATVLDVSTDYLLGLSEARPLHPASGDLVSFSEADPVRRATADTIFAGVERLPDDLRGHFYDALQLLYLGVSQKRRERSR